MAIGTRMRERREALEMTQARLAREADLVPTDICRFETGRNEPRPKTLKRIAVALGVSTDWLLELEPAAATAEEQ